MGAPPVQAVRIEYRDALNIFILVVFVLSQPILSLLGNNPIFFIVRRSDFSEIAALTFFLCVVVPGLCALSVLFAYRLSHKLGRLVGALLVMACCSLLLAPLLIDIAQLTGKQIVVLNLCISALLTALYMFWTTMRTFVSYLLPAVVIFPLMFLFGSNIQNVVAISDPEETPHQITRPSSIVMVVFDSMPLQSLLNTTRQIDAERFPNFARLASKGTWYRNASTVNESTWWAVPSLLTGRDLFGGVALPMHSIHPQSLFTAFGHQLEYQVTENISKLCPEDLCRPQSLTPTTRWSRFTGLLQDVAILYQHTLYPKELAERLPRINETLGGFAQGNVSAGDDTKSNVDLAPGTIAEQFVASVQPAEKPQFYFLHTLLPHAPWRYTPSGKEYGAGHFARIHGLLGIKKRWGEDQWAVNVAYQRHLLQVGYVDRVLGKLIDKLHVVGLYDDTMLIVVSDHGNSYRANEYHRSVTDETKADILGVPLFIKYPGQKSGQIDDRNVSLVDVLPTIFDQLGVRSDWPLEGASLLGSTLPAREGKHIRDLQQNLFEVSADYYEESTTIEDKYRLLATGENIDDLFNISLYPALNGKELTEFKLQPSADEFLIYNADQFGAIDLASNYLPLLVSGEAPGLALKTPLAIALNGKIMSVTRVFSEPPKQKKFAAMLPESEFLSGKNTLSIHRLKEQGGIFTLFESTIGPLK